MFGNVPFALDASKSKDMELYLDKLFLKLDQTRKDQFVSILTYEKDLNLRSFFEKCLEFHFNDSFKFVLDKFMQLYGPMRNLQDQRKMIEMQETFNSLTSQLFYNEEVVRHIINQP